MLTPSEIIARKSLVLQGEMSSADWEIMSAAVKERAFFSSRVASANFLDVCQAKISDLLADARNSDGAITSRAEVVSAIMRAAREEGIALGTNRLSDPGSEARANVIIDTNASMAAGYVQAEIANTYGARLAFPAQELVRIEEREKPRDWRRKWVESGGKLCAGRMVAVKGDPIWTAISRFGLPYPPFDYNSGMGVDAVSYDEAVALGVIDDGYQPPKESPLKEFNDGLEAGMKVSGPRSAQVQKLKEIFGDQIQYNAHTKSLRFDGAMIHNVVAQLQDEMAKGLKNTGVKAKPSVGRPSALFNAKVPGVEDSNLRLSPSNLWHTLQDHVGIDKDPGNNVALSARELGMIGHVWRSPDSVAPADDGVWELAKVAADGNIYRLFVSVEPNGGLVFHTFYKKKRKK